MVWDITSIFHSPGKFVGWCEGSRGDSWAGAPGEQLLLLLPEPPVFPLVPPQFILASCASTVFVELNWSEKWSRLKITFWGVMGGTWAQLRGTTGRHRKQQRSWERWRLPWLSTTIRGNAERKLSLALTCSPPSSCAPERAICSLLSHLTPCLTEVLLPQLSCCWS